jgi:maleate isomerase
MTTAVKIIPGSLQAPTDIVARIGLIVLSTDEIGMDAFFSLMPKSGVRVFATRTAYLDDAATAEFRLRDSYKEVADTLPPEGRFDVLAFSCTSATVATGAQQTLSLLGAARPGLPCTTPAVGAVRAMQAMGARRIALLTPYPVAYHRKFQEFFPANDVEISADGTFDLQTDAEIGELARDSLFAASRELVHAAPTDALFVSCTATPIVPHLQELEDELGVPVIASSQAMAWDALRLGGYRRPIAGFGRLMQMPR